MLVGAGSQTGEASPLFPCEALHSDQLDIVISQAGRTAKERPGVPSLG